MMSLSLPPKDLWNAAGIYQLDAENDDEASSSSIKRLSGLDFFWPRVGGLIMTSKTIIPHTNQRIINGLAKEAACW